MNNENTKTIKYFSMFTGVGGFELGLSRSNRNVGYPSKEENLSNSTRDKSISEKQQEGINYSTDKPETQSYKDSSGTLFQDGQEQSNTFSRDMEQIEDNAKLGQSLRQASSGILSERDGIRDDKEGMEQQENSSNIKQFQGIGFSEIDKYANQLLANKFPGIKNYGDATKIIPSELPDFDMLCGGFPCQSFSIAGKRRGFEDTRGTMFFHIARILETKRPRLVFLENVKGLLNHDSGKTFSIIIQTLEELGYRTQWMVLNSKFFGVPQNRERVFIIGSFRGQPRPEILPFRINNAETYELNQSTRQEINIIDDVARINKGKQGDRMKMDGDCFTLNSIEARGIGIAIPGSQAMRVYTTELAPTLKGLGVGMGAKTGLYAVSNSSPREFKWNNERSPALCSRDYKQPKIVNLGFKIRRLTPIECERLQGFPDNWTAGFSDTQRYKMMGNAVTVNVIKAIGKKLI